MTVTIKGGPELRARLEAIASSQTRVEMLRDWQGKATSGIHGTSPRRTGRGQASIQPSFLSDMKARIVGAYWLIFVDRGTKPHDIRPKRDSGSKRGGEGTARALKFDVGGKTVFARKVHRRRMPRRPFITEAAQRALRESELADHIVQAWNRKRAGRFTRTR